MLDVSTFLGFHIFFGEKNYLDPPKIKFDPPPFVLHVPIIFLEPLRNMKTFFENECVFFPARFGLVKPSKTACFELSRSNLEMFQTSEHCSSGRVPSGRVCYQRGYCV